MTRTNLLTTTTLLFLLSLSLLWIMPATADNTEKNIYVCGCGTAANCDKVATEPGKAPCGKALIEKQVLREDADKIYVCSCPAGCKCGLNQADSAKCACGKDLRAYPKTGGKGMVGGCDKPCVKAAAGCDKPCAAPVPAESVKPCCIKQAAAK